MNPIDALFQRLRSERRKAFLPFVAAGDPDLPTSVRLARALVRAGANLLEIGFPYSDPIADGPVIQAAYTRALAHGLKLDEVFAAVRQLSGSEELAGGKAPLVAMASFSLIHRRGAEAFIRQAQSVGMSGAIVPDLPVEESVGLAEIAGRHDFKLIQLITPTTPRDRAREIARHSTGFIYCVSVTGITGVRDQIPAELLEQLAWLRTQTDLPLCVGFGISRPEHVAMLREVADGIIVGSALVRKMEEAGTRPVEQLIDEASSLVRSLIAALE